METRAFGERLFLLVFLLQFFFRDALVLWRLLVGARLLSASYSQQLPAKISPTNPVRAHLQAQRAALRGPRGRWGRREHHPPPRASWSQPVRLRSGREAGNLKPGKDLYRAAVWMREKWNETLRSGLFA